MSVKLVVTSLWQNLFWVSKAVDLATANHGLSLGCARGVVRSSVALVEKLAELVQ